MELKYEVLKEEIKKKVELLTLDNLKKVGIAGMTVVNEFQMSPKLLIKFNSGKEQIIAGASDILTTISNIAAEVSDDFSENLKNTAPENVYKVRAKFKCDTVTQYEGGGKNVVMSAVTTEEGDNAQFAKYTPMGSLQLSITNETEACNWFKPGQLYYLDFTEAPVK